MINAINEKYFFKAFVYLKRVFLSNLTFKNNLLDVA